MAMIERETRAVSSRTLLEERSVLNLSAIAAIVLWSATAPFTKYALREVPVLVYTMARPLVSVLILAGLLLYQRKGLLVDRADLPRLIATGMVGIGASQLCFTTALSRTSVAHTVIIASTSPLLVAAYRMLVRRQRLPLPAIIGLCGGFGGVVILMAGTGNGSETSLLGDSLALLSSITWMGATMWPVALIKKYGSPRTNLWMFASSLLVSAPVGLWSLGSVIENPPGAYAWGSLVYTALFGMVVANYFWQRAVQQVGGPRTLVYLYLQPVGAMAIAALLLGERLSPLQAAGGLLALVGVSLVRRD
jgi:drug/metabolite transporter (DMT)-like permease